MNILLVDDEPLVRSSMARLIVNLHPTFTLREAEDGEEALQLLETAPADLVITDIRMPAVNGLELSKRIRERWPDMLIVMLTGYADFQYAQEAIRYNVKEYLLKPVSIDHLRRVIAQAEEELKSRRAIEEVGKLRAQSLLEKRVQDLFYELPLPYYDESLFQPFHRFALYAFGMDGGAERGRTARFAVKNVAADVMAPYGAPVAVVGEHGVTVVLFVRESEANVTDETLATLADAIPELAKSVLKLDVRASFGGVSAQLKDIREMYRESLRALGGPQEPEPEPAAEAANAGDGQVHRIVRAAMDIIQERYAEDLTLTSIAETLFVSPNYLSSLFKTETGSTFTHHLTKARMNRAKQLLRETNQKIYQICEQVGYADQAHFSRMFKALEGMSPFDYRTKTNI